MTDWSLKVLARRIRNTPPGAMTISVEWLCGLLGTTATGLQDLIAEVENAIVSEPTRLNKLRIRYFDGGLDMVVDDLDVDVARGFLQRLKQLATHSQML